MQQPRSKVRNYTRGVQALSENDLAAAREIFSDEIVYRVPGKSPIAGEYHGISEFGDLLKRVRELSGGTVSFEPTVVLTDTNSVMMYGRSTAKREGKSLELEQAYLYLFDDDGKVVEGRTIPTDLYAFDEFWE